MIRLWAAGGLAVQRTALRFRVEDTFAALGAFLRALAAGLFLRGGFLATFFFLFFFLPVFRCRLPGLDDE